MNAQALTEVYDIINQFEPNMYEKIPKNFIKYIEQNKDNNYFTEIDFSKSINEQNIRRETKIILSIVYREFICDKELRKKLIQYDFNIIEAEKKDIYNPNKKFKNRKERIEGTENVLQQENKVMLVEYKESVFDIIINFIKKLFHR